MRSVTLIAILQVFIITAILILTIFASIGANQPLLSTHQGTGQQPSILTTNKATLNYSQTAQQILTTPPTCINFLEEVERHILALTNQERRKLRLKALKHDQQLQAAARIHSVDMLERKFFDHANPDGKTPFDRIALIVTYPIEFYRSQS